MSGYTVEDFEKASFARHENGSVAARAGSHGMQWLANFLGVSQWKIDLEMAADGGWVPVVESRVTEGTLRHVEERAERKRERLIRHVSDLEGTIRRRGAALEDLREKLADAERRAELAEWTQDKIAGEANDLRQEIDRLERIIQSPLSLKVLEVAWEAAEAPTDDNPFREGDVVIMKHSEGFNTFRVGGGPHGYLFDSGIRILSRAPREPWVELAGVLHDVINQGGDDRTDVDSTAARLYAEGVRVTGGEES